MKKTDRLLVIITCMCLFVGGQLACVNAAQLGDIPADKILFLGNSITTCPPNWWGLSASTADNDYVHLLTQSIDNATGGSLVLEQTSPPPDRWYYGDPLPDYNGNIINICDIFEKNYNTWDNARIQNQLDWNADIVVLQFGENLENGTIVELETALDTMLTGLKNSSNPHIFVTSNILGVNPSVDAVKRSLCAEDPTHRVFVDLNFVSQNPVNMGDYDHPSDAGMAVIADTLFDAMAPAPPMVYGPNMITNGGFDTDMDGWAFPAGSGGRTDGTEPDPSPDGPSVLVNLVSWLETKPTDPLVAGQTYEVSFLARIVGSAGEINEVDKTMYAHMNCVANGVLGSSLFHLTSTWEEYSFQFTPALAEAGGDYGLGFLNCAASYGMGTDGPGWAQYGIDSVSLTTIMERPIPGDANADGVVNAADAAVLATNWQTASGATWGMGDFNDDGAVNDIDATILAANWQSSGASASVPEPTTLILMAVGLFYLCCWRKRKAC